ncbi:conjugal transfer protein [Halorientalis sp. IM1011]|uniref:VirB4 family type IV secretion system protein n=1 Tax=Halorientalis sp. IM1011 TaxID=1932360 RepID=UPI00097CCDB3|nr:conjugal transfer protein [Halorientalis sp. IM1011]AQL41640.1 conjugal transfer protein [Halorientalis sp. IM1011]
MSTDSADREYSARRIHESLGGTTPFFRGYSIGELMLFVAVAFVSFVAAGVSSALTIPAMGFGVAASLLLFVLHKVKPDYLWLTEWLSARLSWAIKNEEYTHDEDSSEVRYLTRLSRVYPHAIERTDGALVGAVKVEPANMALEGGDSWSRAVGSLSDFVNATVDFPAKIYLTSREIDNDDVVRAHRDRLGDPDVRSRPVLEWLLEQYLDYNTNGDGEIDSETSTVREYYIITAVTDSDVDTVDESGDSVLAYLADLPVIGKLFTRFQSDGLTDAEITQLKENELESRLSQIRSGAKSLYRCSVDPVEAHELARVTKEYWTNQTEEYDDIEEAFPTSPVVAGDERTNSVGTGGVDGASDTEVENEEKLDQEEKESSEQLDSTSKIHQSVVAPTTVDWETTYAVLDDDTYVRTFWIERFPEQPPDGMLEKLLLETNLHTDISIHIDPFDSQSAKEMIADWISDLKVEQYDSNSLKAEELQQDIDSAKEMKELVRSNRASFYRCGVFIRLSADSKRELDNQTTQLQSIVKDAPANCTLKVANRWQEKGLATVSPLGANELGRDRISTMTNQAIGAMFPFSSNYLMMDGGVEYGHHGHNGTPVRINPWDLETGHSELVTGTPGAGKTFGAIMRALRMMKRREDTMLVLVDPVGDFQGIADALDAKTITVGGDTNLNPLEIRETSTAMVEDGAVDSPLSAKKDEAYAIIENFLTARGIDLGKESGVLSYVIDEAYRQAGVVEDDVSTHTPENSPTMADVLRILADISADPSAHSIAESEKAQQKASDYAENLEIALQPFREGGAYSNLSNRSEVNILEGDNKVVYIDLGEIEGSASGIDRQTFLMQLLLSTIYQQAKKADKHVELAIDEAHYLFEDQANLDFLETAFRHQRHAGLRMTLLSQTVQEFYETEQAEKIISMCPIKVFHRLPELDDETADKIGLTREQRDFVRGAQSGKEGLGFSQGLVQVQEHGTYPLHVVADDYETHVIDYDEDDQRIIKRAINDVPAELLDFQQRVEEEARQNALQNRFGLSDETVSRLAKRDVTEQDVVDAVVSQTLENGSEPTARPDGGESTDSEFVETTSGDEDDG